MSRERCSATVITLNEEANIRECLESLTWADEIVVVDSGSSDRTVAIAREFTQHVFVNPWPGHQEQKNFAVDQASFLWVFSLDADERVPKALQARIASVLESPTHDGYCFPRQNFFLGKWLRHGGWYPDAVLRLFRKDCGRFGGINPHDKVIVTTQRVASIDVPLVHYTYTSLGQYVSKQHAYADAAAHQVVAAGEDCRVSAFRIAGKTTWKLLETYLWKRGFLDGTHGLIAAIGSSYGTFLKHVRIWELQREAANTAIKSVNATSRN